MAQALPLLITILFVGAFSDRSQHLERLSNYELIHIDVDNPKQSLTTIHFTAFGEAYSVELKRNNNLIPANVRHTNGNPAIKAGYDDHFNSQTTSCHYLGKVANTDKPSSAMISMCDKRGIRGHIHIDNETLTIYPSAYYMDTSKNHHLLEDEHIIYKASDENVEKPTFGSVANPHLADFTQKVMDDTAHQQRRTLLANGGTNILEILIFLDPSIGKYYQGEYPDASNPTGTWYTQMTADMTDAINWVSGVYEVTDWTTAIGDISLTIVEFEYAEAWTGKYTSLQPPFLYSNCLNYFSAQCAIRGDDWLDVMQTWINKYKDTSTFDNFMAIHFKHLSNPNSNSFTSGWGTLDAVCQRGRSVNNNRLNPEMSGNGLTSLRETIAHELGHNFGADHDQNHPDGCNTNSGLMGYGIVSSTFSQCSKNDFNDYFASANMGCLAKRTQALSVINTGDAPGAINGRPTSAPTITPDCLTISNHPWGGSMNGNYQFSNEYYNDHKVYYSSSSGKYLWYTGSSWYIYRSVGGDTYNNYCPAQTIYECDRNWYFNEEVNNARLYRCGGSPGDLSVPTPQPSSKQAVTPEPSSPITPSPTTRRTPSPVAPAPVTPAPVIITPAPTPYVTSSSGELNCVRLSGFNWNGFDGDYKFNGQYHDNQKVYAQEGGEYYIWYKEYWKEWFIHNHVFGNSYYSLCLSEDIGGCDLNWSGIGGAGARLLDCNTGLGVTPHPTPAPPPIVSPFSGCGCDMSCYMCLTLTSLQVTVDGHDLNGEYTPIGSCVNNRAAYQRSDGAYYLYYDAIDREWFISTGLDDFGGLKAYAPRCRNDVRRCSNNWWYLIETSTNTFTQDNASPIDDVCNSCDSCFTDDNVECLEVSKYQQDVCLFNNNTVFNGYTNFKFMEACAYDMPVWYYSYDGNNNDTNESVTYYLHYDKYYKYQTDESLSVRWIISEREISIPGIAVCEQQHLTNCTNNSWIVSKSEGDYYQRVIEEGMTFYNSHCDVAQGLGSDDDDNNNKPLFVALFVCITLAVFAIFAGIVVFCMYRNGTQRKKIKNRMDVETNQQQNITPIPDDEDQEIEFVETR